MGGDLGMMGGGGGMPGGGMGVDMGMGGMGAGMGAGMGGEMGVPGGEMGMGGVPAPVGGAPAGGPMVASEGLKITKKGKSKKEEEVKAPPPRSIRLTSLEYKMLKILRDLDVPYGLFAQYQVKMAGQAQPYVLDFAYPKIGVGIESDGSIWHDRNDLVQKDMSRDQKLSNVGWTILRFKEKALSNHPDVVRKIIGENIKNAIQVHRKRSLDDNQFAKFASNEPKDNYFNYLTDSGDPYMNIVDLNDNIGNLIKIGY